MNNDEFTNDLGAAIRAVCEKHMGKKANVQVERWEIRNHGSPDYGPMRASSLTIDARFMPFPEPPMYMRKPESPKETHAGHDVIENMAGGKTFKYCRNCKTEVL